MPPAAPEPMMTKSTSSEFWYCTRGVLIFSPRRRAASRDSLCRARQTEAETCAPDHGRSLSSRRHRGCRGGRHRVQSESRRSCDSAMSQKKAERCLRDDWRGGFWEESSPCLEPPSRHLAVPNSRPKISSLREMFQRGEPGRERDLPGKLLASRSQT